MGQRCSVKLCYKGQCRPRIQSVCAPKLPQLYSRSSFVDDSFNLPFRSLAFCKRCDSVDNYFNLTQSSPKSRVNRMTSFIQKRSILRWQYYRSHVLVFHYFNLFAPDVFTKDLQLSSLSLRTPKLLTLLSRTKDNE